MKKYYLSFIFSFCFLLGFLFVGSADIYASAGKDQYGFNCTDVDASFSYVYTDDLSRTFDISPNGSTVYIIPIMYLYRDHYYVKEYFVSLKPFSLNGSFYTYQDSKGYYIKVGNNTDIGSENTFLYSYLWCDSVKDTDLENTLYSYLSGTLSDEFIFAVDSSFDEVSAEYDPNIGYLDNVQSKYLFLNDSPSIEDGQVPYMEKISYSYKTTTDFDIRQEGVQIQYGFYVHGYGNFLGGIGSKIDIPDYKSPYYYAPTDVNYISIDGSMFSSIIDSWKSGTDKLYPFSGVRYGIDKWLRVVYFDGNKSYYGGWTQITFNEDDNELVSIVNKGITNDGQINSNLDRIDDAGPLDKYSGCGDTYEDAEANSNYVSGSDGSGDIQANFNSLLTMVGNIPLIISRLFSFLPPWCLAFVGMCFAILVVLIVKKAIF